ncbi:glycoside hydrolase family 76 protein [Stipitochalara longipes BDJ]|nr:glycoside hydrolase family 76 protein [Stipitochalara longipes BDJ]
MPLRPASQDTDASVNQHAFRLPAGTSAPAGGDVEGLCSLPHSLRTCFNADSYIWPAAAAPQPWSPRELGCEVLVWLYIMLCRSFRALSLLSFGVASISAASQDYTGNAEAAFKVLQSWYNTNTGIWNTTGWWNSANCLTVIGDLAAVDSSVKTQVSAVYANSIVAATNLNLGVTKIVLPDYNIETFYTDPTPGIVSRQENPNGFLNGFYDDEGWWALGWIQAYDITGTTEYLNTAIDIFTDMKNGSTTPCHGGIWWDKKHTYVNAIANELYLSVAAHLANRMSQNKASYLSIAQSQWTWFQQSGMINSKSLINDGLTGACKNNNGTVWSYNQGVILGALVELNKASPNSSYISTAHSIANAAIKALSDSNGVLHDPCEPNCGADGSQFKGIFMRNLQLLQSASPKNSYLSFIATNAASIWAKDRNAANQLSVDWAGPFVGSANASTQSSALDALVAAAAFQGQLRNGIASRRSRRLL